MREWLSACRTQVFWMRMYCVHCGTRLKLKLKKKIYRKGDPEWKSETRYLRWHNPFLTSIEIFWFDYICPCCGRETTCDEQLEIRKRQKMFNRKIIPQNNDEIQVDCKEPKS